MRPSKDIHTLLDIMAALRTPVSGCPWDLEQDFATIAPYTIEEAYEVADAIARHDLMDLKDELGDLLLQVVFHARMAEEIDAFSFGDVVAAITAKMIRRHPHVFAATEAATPEAVKRNWEDIKAEERAERHAEREMAGAASLLDDVPLALPALQRAVKLQKRAARVGFDWDDSAQVIAKIHEEIDEVSEAAEAGDRAELADEIGDVLFAVANFARHFGVDPEDALRGTNDKFRRRFAHIEQQARAEGTPLEAVTLERMEGWWQDAKKTEGAPALSRGAALSRTAD